MDINQKNETTGEDEMVGVGLFLEDIKQEPTYHPEINTNISNFSGNNDPLDTKSKDFLVVEHLSSTRRNVDFFANNDPLNIKSEDVDVAVENRLSIVQKTTKSTNMLGEIIDAIKPENDGVLLKKISAATPVSDTTGKPTCEICGFTFASKQGLKRHGIVHKNPSKVYTFKCGNCPYVSKYKHSLEHHILNLHGPPSRPKRFSCEMCDMETNRKASMKKHMVLKHSSTEIFFKQEEKVYNCDSCGYTTHKRCMMVKHVKVHKPQNKCHLCPYQSKHGSGVQNHLLTHKSPSETPLYKCELCSYETKWRHCLRNHIKAHENNSEYPTIRKCEACEFTTNNIYSLEIHMKSHAVRVPPEKIYICFICEYQAKRKCHLVNHMLHHKPPSQVTFLECAVCGFLTKSSKGLKNHMLVVHEPMANVEIKPNY